MTGEFILRLLVAAILGSLIGLDREYRAKEAGYRTHLLVSLGSALMMIVSQYGFTEAIEEVGIARFDPARVAAQVVTGIGFIGAGTIILQRQVVRGLTTAAGIWATAGIGLAVGAGMYVMGIATTVLTLIGLELLPYLMKNVSMKSSLVEFQTHKKETLHKLSKLFNTKNFKVISYQMEEQQKDGEVVYVVSMLIKSTKSATEGGIMALFNPYDDVIVTRIE
ncbi:MAG: MgtC/SapB family protein [Phocaeicola sp.]|nr:MgtC/SapB family protein [Phocaeicola sp.]